MTPLVALVPLLALALAAEQPCPVELSAPVSSRSRTLTTAGGSTFEAQLWSDGSRACPCLQRGCVRKCCPAGFVSDQLGDCVPVSTDTAPTVRPLTPVQDYQPPSRHLEALIPKVVAIVEQLGNKSGGNLTSPVNSSEGAQPDEAIRNLSSTLFRSLTEVHPEMGRQSSDDNVLLYTMSDTQLPTVRQRESGMDHQPSAKHLAILEVLIPKVVAIVERLNSSGGNLTAPLNSSGDAQLQKLPSVSFESLPAATKIGPGTGRQTNNNSALLYTTSDRQLSTARLQEAVKVLLTQLDNVYPATSTAGVSELVDELKESLANISNELSDSDSGAVNVGSGSDRTPGTIETLLSLLADRTDAPLRDMFVLYGQPCPCGRYETDEAFEILANGSLAFETYTVPVSEYCFGETEHGNLTLYLCFPASACPEEELDAILFYPAGTVLSLPFLAATFAVYALFEELRNRVGAALMCYVAALFVGYALLAAVQLSMGYVSMAFCLAAAFIIYFSFLASFFWLNVMCFDIFWTFSGFRSLRGTAREREHKKFIIYSIYSWGCPLILLCVTLVMQFHDNIPDGLLRPQFGEKKCWFPDDITILAYFYGPVGILVLCNIILFILTAIRIAQLKRETAMLKGADSRRHDDDNRQRFNLYLKLFLVMGVNWSMEVISGLVGGPEYVWYVTDICNTLQGVLIFVIFVWKDRIRRMLMEKFCPKRASTKLSKSTLVTYSTRTSPSRLSHGVLNNKVTDNSNGDVKITAITHISDDSDVP